MKVNYWVHPDLRVSGRPAPHNHPWTQFNGHILRGWYEEDRYEVSNGHLLVRDPHSKHDLGTVTVQQDVLHKTGDINTVGIKTFHEVKKVAPGTLTVMNCSEGVKEGWGEFDPDTSLYVPNKLSPIDPVFAAMKLERNKHHRRAKR